ncbi:ABC transporter ATP-binding protein/permease [Curtanaerobium respiraculi]|uniref:ABC transporter ATP-binding protein/permease n=1 Tax=Curtanaerobium respiraculi TaxID=2949669 RepID=UPI0024B3982F|nr:ABC transporter ATP-binding protein/permease [Curtanaerobium respiraculi]
MIELKELRKSYKTGDFVQKALDGVSLNFRDNEFVAILGQSGSGKTTLLNILGGLDHADSGDIAINGVSTRDYKGKDWDAYRNHRIGFIFQSYNLIPHQSILSNVELALTLSGISRGERKRRATDELKRVGLSEHLHKKPSQLSGGQMQRVAIARALVNDPDIVLADEPTGALDTDTGIQVMDLLKEIASDRLVIMVTHNPKLAEQYATRIVNLADGRIVGDSDPFDGDLLAGGGEPAGTLDPANSSSVLDRRSAAHEFDSEGIEGAAEREVPKGFPPPASAPSAQQAMEGSPTPAGAPVPGSSEEHGEAGHGAGARQRSSSGKSGKKASMSFLTALALSFNNLMTKKGRTFMTAFAGSIGIIGIAAILALSNGVNNYIADTEEEALTSYPITITKSSFDISSLLTATMGYTAGTSGSDDAGDGASNENAIPQNSIMTDMFAQVKNNNLSAFKEYLESGQSDIYRYVNTVQYNYGIKPQIYYPDTSKGVVRLNPSTMAQTMSNGISGSALSAGSSGMGAFSEMLDDQELLESRMDVVAGRWAQSYDEAVLVLSSSGQISDYMLYSLGVYDPEVMNQMTQDALNGKEVVVPEITKDFTYDDALGLSFKVVPASSLYQYNADQNIWSDISGDTETMKQRIADGIDLKIVGVVKPSAESTTPVLSEGVAYMPGLTRQLIQIAGESDIVKQQKDHPDVDVFTGKTFEELQSEGGTNFDMGSMFTVDEDALSRAFSFDASALSSGMDFSGMDLSGLDMSGMSIDPSSLQMDPSAMSSVFSEETMRQIMANAPKPDLSKMNPDLSKEQQAAIGKSSGDFMAGFMAWATTKYGPAVLADQEKMAEAWAKYQESNEGKAALKKMQDEVGPTLQSAVQTAMQDYMTNQFAPYLATAMQALMQQAAQVMANEMATSLTTQMAVMTNSVGNQLSSAISGQLQSQMASLSNAMQNGFSFDADAFADAIKFNMDQDDLTSLLTSYMNSNDLTYDNNMGKLGYAELSDPQSISIYPTDFPAKESVIGIIDDYNDKMNAEGNSKATIQYSDIAGTLMSSVTSIVDTISLVLIAFVSISLVVSSIMIGIITYISVLERKKEIGILRAMGASKLNIANVFNAETIIEGLIAGVLAIAVVYLASLVVNPIVYAGWNVPQVMILPVASAAVLVGISVLLTFVAGLIPSSAASRRDPVEALRSE